MQVISVIGGLLVRAAAPQPRAAERSALEGPQLLGLTPWQLVGCCALAASAVGARISPQAIWMNPLCCLGKTASLEDRTALRLRPKLKHGVKRSLSFL